MYVVGSYAEAVVAFRRNPASGQLAQVDVERDRSAGGAAQGLELPRDVAVSPDGENVYVTSPAADSVVTFTRDPTDGSLRWLESDVDSAFADGLNGAWGIAVAPDGTNVYVTGLLDLALVTFARDPVSGGLHWTEVHRENAGGLGPIGAVLGLDESPGGGSDVRVSPDGANVYLADTFTDAVITFRRSRLTGDLTRQEHDRDLQAGGEVSGLTGASALAVSPDGDHVYVASQVDHAIVTFARDERGGLEATGVVEAPPRGGAIGLTGASAVEVSEDGGYVHAAGFLDDDVATFVRDPASGALRWVGPIGGDGVTGEDGLDGAADLALAPDAPRLYATGRFDDAVVELARNSVLVEALPPPAVRISDASLSEGNAGEATLRFTVTLNYASSEAVRVAYRTGDRTASSPTDYQGGRGARTIPAGRLASQVSISVHGDALPEGDELFVVDLLRPSGATIADARAVGRLIDDDRRAPTGERPNVLLVVTDDQRADSMTGMPRTLEIFADGGTGFTNAYATQPLCCPSRASIYSGRYPHNHGISANDGTRFDATRTWQRILQFEGYLTGISGKYLNQVLTDAAPYFSFRSGDWSFNDPDDTRKSLAGALQFLDQAEQDDARPWALVVTPTSPHYPWNVQPSVPEPFPEFEPSPAFGESDLSDKGPAVRQRGLLFSARGAELSYEGQAVELQAVDEMVGGLFDRLEQLGEQENTMAIFTSDNGLFHGEHGLLGKSWPYLEAARVPFYLRWPHHVAAGAVRDDLVANIDIAPTILKATSARSRYTMDGRSLLGATPREWLLLESPGQTIMPRWSAYLSPSRHYIEWRGGFVEDYDLDLDPTELTAENAPDPLLSATLAEARRCEGVACP